MRFYLFKTSALAIAPRFSTSCHWSPVSQLTPTSFSWACFLASLIANIWLGTCLGEQEDLSLLLMAVTSPSSESHLAAVEGRTTKSAHCSRHLYRLRLNRWCPQWCSLAGRSQRYQFAHHQGWEWCRLAVEQVATMRSVRLRITVMPHIIELVPVRILLVALSGVIRSQQGSWVRICTHQFATFMIDLVTRRIEHRLMSIPSPACWHSPRYTGEIGFTYKTKQPQISVPPKWMLNAGLVWCVYRRNQLLWIKHRTRRAQCS